MSEEGLSRRLAQFVTQSRWEDVPEPVRYQARRSLVNWLGCTLGGVHDAAAEIAANVLGGFSARPEATVIGRSERFDILTSSFLNGMAANVFDFDDTHLRTVIHPSAPVFPALFALAETRPVTGEQLLHAFVLGVEVECRLGNAVSPGHYARGFHITSTCGVFGAAAATGKILGLNEDQMLWALGNAATQSCGVVENLGTMAKSIGVGNAARNGLLSALLAEQNYSSSETPIEGERGFLRVKGHNPDFGAVSDGLGETWELADNTYKPYPSGIVIHPVVDACLELRQRIGSNLGDNATNVRRIIVSGHPLLAQRGDRRNPANGREAKVSVQHTVAGVFLQGAAGLAQYTDELVADDAFENFRRRIRVVEDQRMAVGAAHVEVVLTDGSASEAFVPHARGSQEKPMSDADLEQKLRELAAYGSPFCDTRSLIAAAWQIEQAPDAASLLALTVPPAS